MTVMPPAPSAIINRTRQRQAVARKNAAREWLRQEIDRDRVARECDDTRTMQLFIGVIGLALAIFAACRLYWWLA